MDAMIEKVQAESDPEKRRELVLQQALPLREKMVAQAELATQWKMNTTSTTGGLGAVANLQQMVLTNSLAVHSCSKNGASHNGCQNYTALLLNNSGLAQLPATAMPAAGFRGVERCFATPTCVTVDISFRVPGHSAVARLRYQGQGVARRRRQH